MDKIRSFFLRCRGNPDTATHLDEARQQYEELLAYVRWLERMLVSGAREHMIKRRPEWLQRDVADEHIDHAIAQHAR